MWNRSGRAIVLTPLTAWMAATACVGSIMPEDPAGHPAGAPLGGSSGTSRAPTGLSSGTPLGGPSGTSPSPSEQTPGAKACSPAARVTAHRLNALEYDNTLADLLGIASRPSAGLPPDASGTVFFNDAAALAAVAPGHVEKYFAVSEQVVSEALTRNRGRIVTCDPAATGREACTRSILLGIVERAYRRLVEQAEVDELVKVSRRGATFDEGLSLALRAIVSSPSFLYRTAGSADGGVYALNDFELASRLSYFLWSTMPDDQLFMLARGNQLRHEGTVREQVKRMLKDSRARAFVEHFAEKWLGLDNLEQFVPDPKSFPGFPPQLRSDMKTETTMLIQDLIDNDRSALALISADYTFVNERLAAHYGLPRVTGTSFKRVPLADAPRRGLVTHASILSVTSHPNATNISKRGNWVRSTLLCAPAPPPPEDIPETRPPPGFRGTRRELTELHRSNPACAGCHSLMDPIGFGLENYDAIGRYRTHEGTLRIDNLGVLPDGRSFRGALELVAVLERDAAYPSCVAETLLTYALGRETTGSDRCTVDKLATAASGRFSDLVTAVVLSEPFRRQPSEGVSP